MQVTRTAVAQPAAHSAVPALAPSRGPSPPGPGLQCHLPAQQQNDACAVPGPGSALGSADLCPGQPRGAGRHLAPRRLGPGGREAPPPREGPKFGGRARGARWVPRRRRRGGPPCASGVWAGHGRRARKDPGAQGRGEGGRERRSAVSPRAHTARRAPAPRRSVGGLFLFSGLINVSPPRTFSPSR